MTQDTVFGGIDCGKDALDIAVFPSGETLGVPNSEAGHRTLMAWLAARGVVVVGLEASGGYERRVRDALAAEGIAVHVFDPARVRHFAKAKGQRAKTDPIDAALIAEFTAFFRPASAPPANPHREGLAELLGLRRLLVAKRADLKKALARLPASAAALLGPVLAVLDTAIARAEDEITRHAEADMALVKRTKALRSAPGVGALTALTLAVRVPELGRLSGAQAAALLGVAPYPDDSGKRQGARRIAGGREDARRALYMAALAAATGRHKGALSEFYARLIVKGKPAKVALTACMRKLIVRLNAMLAAGKEGEETPA